MSFKVDKLTGAIHFPDGFILPAPYDHERYFEYVEWIGKGNSPEEIESNTMLADEDIEVSPYQARTALDAMGVYDTVLALMAHKDTPRAIKIKWEFTLSFRRNDDAVIMMAVLLKWTKQFLDELFALAKTIK